MDIFFYPSMNSAADASMFTQSPPSPPTDKPSRVPETESFLGKESSEIDPNLFSLPSKSLYFGLPQPNVNSKCAYIARDWIVYS